MSIGLDGYSLKARWSPCLLVAGPLVVAVASWSPNITLFAGFGISLLAAAAIALSQLARNRGRDLQTVLWNRWGGPPTTLVLRHGTDRITEPNLRRYRAFIKQLAPDVLLPSPEEERERPLAFEDAYEAATHALINRTRDKKVFAQLYGENVVYGFWRNLLALRPFGIASAGVAVLVAAARLIYVSHGTSALLESPILDPFIRAIFAVVVAMTSLWGFTAVLGEHLARRAAFNYAERLIESSEHLATAK